MIIYDHVMDLAELSRDLRRLRVARGWSLSELARRAGTSAPTVHRYETGWRRFELYTLQKLAAALGCTLDLRLSPSRPADRAIPPRDTRDRLRRIFWDRRLRKADLERFPEWVTRRVLEVGNLDDVRALRAHYGRERFLEIVGRIQFGSKRTRIFWERMLGQEGRPCIRKFSRDEAATFWTL